MIMIFQDIYRNQWSDTPYSKTDVCMQNRGRNLLLLILCNNHSLLSLNLLEDSTVDILKNIVGILKNIN